MHFTIAIETLAKTATRCRAEQCEGGHWGPSPQVQEPPATRGKPSRRVQPCHPLRLQVANACYCLEPGPCPRVVGCSSPGPGTKKPQDTPDTCTVQGRVHTVATTRENCSEEDREPQGTCDTPNTRNSEFQPTSAQRQGRADKGSQPGFLRASHTAACWPQGTWTPA